MSYYAIGVYREPEFSPGKVDADAAIMNAALAELAREGVETTAMDARTFAEADHHPRAALVLAMCPSGAALKRLAEVERTGALAINSALAIRNCSRALLSAGLEQADVPIPPGALVATGQRLQMRTLSGIDLDQAVFVKRGDLHALG